MAATFDDASVTNRALPLERYFRLLELLASYPQGLTLSDLVVMMMLPKGTIHRLLSAMQRTDLVCAGARGSYTVSARVQHLGRLAVDPDVVATLAKPLLQDLSERLGETCYLCRLEGTGVQSIAISSPELTWTGYVLPGKTLQPHATAAGKAIMAYQPAELVEAVIAAGLPVLSSLTITDRDALLAEYAKVREKGYATCIQEVVPELSAFAMPIEVDGIGVRFSVGVLGPHSRMVGRMDKDLAGEISSLANAIRALLNKQTVERRSSL